MNLLIVCENLSTIKLGYGRLCVQKLGVGCRMLMPQLYHLLAGCPEANDLPL